MLGQKLTHLLRRCKILESSCINIHCGFKISSPRIWASLRSITVFGQALAGSFRVLLRATEQDCTGRRGGGERLGWFVPSLQGDECTSFSPTEWLRLGGVKQTGRDIKKVPLPESGSGTFFYVHFMTLRATIWRPCGPDSANGARGTYVP